MKMGDHQVSSITEKSFIAGYPAVQMYLVPLGLKWVHVHFSPVYAIVSPLDHWQSGVAGELHNRPLYALAPKMAQ